MTEHGRPKSEKYGGKMYIKYNYSAIGMGIAILFSENDVIIYNIQLYFEINSQ